MSLGGLLHCLQYVLVDPERDGTEQGQQRHIGKYTDQREQRHGNQDGQASTEHDAGFLYIAPVDQGFH